jgi:hypothetical protein
MAKIPRTGVDFSAPSAGDEERPCRPRGSHDPAPQTVKPAFMIGDGAAELITVGK